MPGTLDIILNTMDKNPAVRERTFLVRGER